MHALQACIACRCKAASSGGLCDEGWPAWLAAEECLPPEAEAPGPDGQQGAHRLLLQV
jgi:hypothetical protein